MSEYNLKKIPKWVKKGAKVNYFYHGAGSIQRQECTIETEPFVADRNNVVVLLDIIPGCVSIDLIAPVL